MFHYEAPSTVSSNHTLQAYLCIRWIQLLTEQLGVRITDVLDAKEALQATRQADRHFKVCYLLHTAQHQHTLLHILENTTTTKKHTQNKDTVLKTLIILLIHHQIIRSLFCSRSVFLILSLWRLSSAGALVAMYFYDNQQRLVCKCVDSVCVNTFTARKGRQKLRTAGLNTFIVNIYMVVLDICITLICRISTHLAAAFSVRPFSFPVPVFGFLSLPSSLTVPFLFLVSACSFDCKRKANYC